MKHFHLLLGVAAAAVVVAGCSRSRPVAASATRTTSTPASAPPVTSRSTTTTTVITSSSPLRLVAGPYGFLVPQGWKEEPLTNAGGPAGFATFFDPRLPHDAPDLNLEISAREQGL